MKNKKIKESVLIRNSIYLFIILFAILMMCSCVDNNIQTPTKQFGRQYYRILQYDFDGAETIYYSNLTVNENPRLNTSGKNEDLICYAEGIELFIGANFTWITVDNDKHDDWLLIDGDTLSPSFCVLNSCTWVILNTLIITQQFIIYNGTYDWSGTSFDCDSVALPIQLIKFKVTPNTDGSNHIEIVTASEINADHMIIERNDDPLNNEWIFVTDIKLENNTNGANYFYIDN